MVFTDGHVNLPCGFEWVCMNKHAHFVTFEGTEQLIVKRQTCFRKERKYTQLKSNLLQYNNTTDLEVTTVIGLNIFYFISHEKGLGRAKMLCHSPLCIMVTHVLR